MSRYRTIICEEDFGIQAAFRELLRLRDHEIYIYSSVTECPLFLEHQCYCSNNQRCADFLIIGVYLHNFNGLDWVAKQLAAGCRIPRIALISGKCGHNEKQQAKELGCSLFDTPFDIFELDQWILNGENNITQPDKYKEWFMSQ